MGAFADVDVQGVDDPRARERLALLRAQRRKRRAGRVHDGYERHA
jgi:hypothetical protein